MADDLAAVAAGFGAALRRARLALTTKDENGEVKLAAEAVIAI